MNCEDHIFSLIIHYQPKLITIYQLIRFTFNVPSDDHHYSTSVSFLKELGKVSYRLFRSYYHLHFFIFFNFTLLQFTLTIRLLISNHYNLYHFDRYNI